MRHPPATSRNSCAPPGTRPSGRPSPSGRTAGAGKPGGDLQHPGRDRGQRRQHRGGGRPSGLRTQEGPGINDNASGVAAVLETARWIKEAGIAPANRVRSSRSGALKRTASTVPSTTSTSSAAPRSGPDRGEPERGHGGLARTACGPCTTATGPISVTAGRQGPRRSRTSSSATSRRTRCRRKPHPSTAAPTTTPFLQAGIPGGGLFSGDAEIRRPKPRCSPTAARPARTSIPATTGPATPSATPTPNCCGKCPAPWPTRRCPWPWPHGAKAATPADYSKLAPTLVSTAK